MESALRDIDSDICLALKTHCKFPFNFFAITNISTKKKAFIFRTEIFTIPFSMKTDPLLMNIYHHMSEGTCNSHVDLRSTTPEQHCTFPFVSSVDVGHDVVAMSVASYEQFCNDCNIPNEVHCIPLLCTFNAADSSPHDFHLTGTLLSFAVVIIRGSPARAKARYFMNMFDNNR
jgi:hypothetical protein